MPLQSIPNLLCNQQESQWDGSTNQCTPRTCWKRKSPIKAQEEMDKLIFKDITRTKVGSLLEADAELGETVSQKEKLGNQKKNCVIEVK